MTHLHFLDKVHVLVLISLFTFRFPYNCFRERNCFEPVRGDSGEKFVRILFIYSTPQWFLLYNTSYCTYLEHM